MKGCSMMDKKEIIKELDNFWYYHKAHVLTGILIVAIVLYVVFTGGESEEAALNVVVVGNAVEEPNQLNLQNTATKDLLGQDSKSVVHFDFWEANDGLANGAHGDLQEKLMAMVTAKDVDAFIMDQEAFELYAKQSIFLNLHDIKSDLPEDTEYIEEKGKKDAQSHQYGIKLDGNKRLEEEGFETSDKVMSIVANTENLDLSKNWVEWVISK